MAITTEFVGFIPKSLVLKSIVVGWILIYRNWSIIIFYYSMLLTLYCVNMERLTFIHSGACQTSNFCMLLCGDVLLAARARRFICTYVFFLHASTHKKASAMMTATRTPQIDWTRSKIRCTPFSLSSEKQQRKISSFENLITVAFTRQFFIEHAYFFVWKKSIFWHKTCNFVLIISAQPFCKRLSFILPFLSRRLQLICYVLFAFRWKRSSESRKSGSQERLVISNRNLCRW